MERSDDEEDGFCVGGGVSLSALTASNSCTARLVSLFIFCSDAVGARLEAIGTVQFVCFCQVVNELTLRC